METGNNSCGDKCKLHFSSCPRDEPSLFNIRCMDAPSKIEKVYVTSEVTTQSFETHWFITLILHDSGNVVHHESPGKDCQKCCQEDYYSSFQDYLLWWLVFHFCTVQSWCVDKQSGFCFMLFFLSFYSLSWDSDVIPLQ